MSWPLRLPEDTDPIAQKIAGRITRSLRDFALSHGLRVHAHEPGTHVWLLRDTTGTHIASLSRDESKKCLTWREIDKPVYGFFPPADGGDAHVTIIVEDALSAALLAESSVNGVTLAGTHLSPETARELLGSGKLGHNTFVALDPDEAGMGSTDRVLGRLRSIGVHSSIWSLKQDVKDMTRRDREAMLDTMWEWVKP